MSELSVETITKAEVGEENKTEAQEENVEKSKTEAQTQAVEENKVEVQAETVEESNVISAGETASSKRKKISIGVLTSLAVCLVAAYVLVAVYYASHFWPGTTVNGVACGNENQQTLMEQLVLQLQDYQLLVLGRNPRTMEADELVLLSAADMGLYNFVSDADVNSLLQGQQNWFWPGMIWGSEFRHTLQSQAVIDEGKLQEKLAQADAFQEKKMIAPSDAYVAGYSEEDGKYILSPETKGSQLDMPKVYEAIRQAVSAGQNELNLDEAGCYVNSAVTAESIAMQRRLDEANRWISARIRYDWNGTEVMVDDGQIRQWVLLQDGSPVLDEDAVAAFVAENAEKYDTYRKNRNFHTILGYDLDLRGGAFGWLTDQELETAALLELIKKGAVCDREPEYASTAPVKGMNDIGTSYVEIDMTHQHLYLYQDGEVVVESDFVSGNTSNGHRTPEGVFGLTYKTKNATLRGADYVSHVHYWMPFNGNVGMHDATWRNKFGGEIYKTSGSHGCINLPLDKAAEIYPYVSKGFPVICYYYPEGMLAEQEAGEQATAGQAIVGQKTEGQKTEGQETEGQQTEGQETEGQEPQGQQSAEQGASGQEQTE